MNKELRNVIDRARGPLSMANFAAKCGVSTNTLYRWIRGNQIAEMHPDTIRKISENAAPGSGITEEEIRIASIGSIKGEDKRKRLLSETHNIELKDNILFQILDTLLREGHAVKQIGQNDNAMEYTYMIDSDNVSMYKICPCFTEAYHFSHETNDVFWKEKLFQETGKYIFEGMQKYVFNIILAVDCAEDADKIEEYAKKYGTGPVNVYSYVHKTNTLKKAG